MKIKNAPIPGLYQLINPVGETYLGSSMSLKRRKQSYSAFPSVKCPLLYESFRKYGPQAHKFEIWHRCPTNITKEEILLLEEIFIDLYQPPLNVNCTKRDTKKYIKGGKPYNKVKIERETYPILQLNKKTGELIKEWPSVSGAAKALNIKMTNLRLVLMRSKNKTSCGGYRWQYKTPHIPQVKVKPGQMLPRQIVMLDYNTKQPLKVYPTIGEAARENKLRRENVGQVARGYLLSCPNKKYSWRFIEDLDGPQMLILLQNNINAMEQPRKMRIKQKVDNIVSIRKGLKSGKFDNNNNN